MHPSLPGDGGAGRRDPVCGARNRARAAVGDRGRSPPRHDRARRGVSPSPAVRRVRPRWGRRASVRDDAATSHCRRPRGAARRAHRGWAGPLASDQCHLRLDRDKLPVQGDFTRVPTGLPGIGARLPLGFALMGTDVAAAERLVEVACEGSGADLRAWTRERAWSPPGATPTWWCGIPPSPARSTARAINDGSDRYRIEGSGLPARSARLCARRRCSSRTRLAGTITRRLPACRADRDAVRSTSVV